MLRPQTWAFMSRNAAKLSHRRKSGGFRPRRTRRTDGAPLALGITAVVRYGALKTRWWQWRKTSASILGDEESSCGYGRPFPKTPPKRLEQIREAVRRHRAKNGLIRKSVFTSDPNGRKSGSFLVWLLETGAVWPSYGQWCVVPSVRRSTLEVRRSGSRLWCRGERTNQRQFPSGSTSSFSSYTNLSA